MKTFLLLILILASCTANREILVHEQNDTINKIMVFRVNIDVKVNGVYGDTVYYIATRKGSYFICKGDSLTIKHESDGSINMISKKVDWGKLDIYADSLVKALAKRI